MSKSYQFQKKIIVNHIGEDDYLRLFSLLINCMKETNKLNNKDCELFTLTFREAHPLDNAGMSPYVLEMKWGER